MPQQQPTPSLFGCRGVERKRRPRLPPRGAAPLPPAPSGERGPIGVPALRTSPLPTLPRGAGEREGERKGDSSSIVRGRVPVCATGERGVGSAPPRPPRHTHTYILFCRGCGSRSRRLLLPSTPPATRPQIKESADSAAGVSAATAATPRLGAAGPGEGEGGREAAEGKKRKKKRREQGRAGRRGGKKGARPARRGHGACVSVCVEEGAPSPLGGGGWRSRQSLPHAGGTRSPSSTPRR